MFTTPITSARASSSNETSRQRQSITPPRVPAVGPRSGRHLRLQAWTLAQRLLEPADLRRVVVGMDGVDAKPGLGAVAAALGVPTLARPIGVGQRRQQLECGRARGAERHERRADLALVV